MAALVTIAKKWKQPRCPSPDGWINKVVYTHNEMVFRHKRTKILIHTTTLMNFENIMRSEKI